MTLRSWASVVGYCAPGRDCWPRTGTPRKRRRNSIDAPKSSQALIPGRFGRRKPACTGNRGATDPVLEGRSSAPVPRRDRPALNRGKPSNDPGTDGFSGPIEAPNARERKIYATRGQKMAKPAPKTGHLPVHLRPIFSTPLEATGIPHVRLIPLPKYRHLRPRGRGQDHYH